MTAPPPRKRQRRLVVQSSDEDEPCLSVSSSFMSSTSQQGLKTRLSPAETDNASASFSTNTSLATARHPKPRSKKTASQALNNRTVSTNTSPASSPEKRKTRKKAAPDKSSSSNSLHSFFAPATEEQRWSKVIGNHTPPLVEEIEDEDEEDAMQNWTGSRSFNTGTSSQNGQRHQTNGYSTVDPHKPRLLESKSRGDKVNAAARLKPTKRFVIPADGHTDRSGHGVLHHQLRPWAERFAPTDLDELAVHKKKVADVQNWLVDVFTGRSRRRILVLRGPAGSGKTTTISLLSKALGYDIIEWKGSSGMEHSSTGYISMATQFDDFLTRSDKFSSLTLSESAASAKHGIDDGINSSGNAKRIVLIEEFPASLNQGSSTLTAFRSTLQRYLATAVPPRGFHGECPNSNVELSPPVIIIVSETLLGTGAALSDNFTVYRLLGPEISNHPGVSIIEFNRVAPTFITKALDLVLKKEARISKRRRVPGPAALRRFAEMGDIRSAIASLEFLCLRGDEDGNWSGTVASRMKRGINSGVALTEMEKESMEAITHREASLGIFHAVGKVIYNKREDPSITIGPSVEVPQPPQHLHHFARRKVSQVLIDDLINETGTDIQTFIAALHENYILSCDGDDFTDFFADCIAGLSDADILSPENRRALQSNRGSVGSAQFTLQSSTSIDMLRQDEISFQVAVRGLLFSLPYPVKRRAVPGTRGSDAYKMFFPTSMRLWRQTEESCGLLDMWTRRLTNPASTRHTSDSNPRSEGVESWRNRRAFGRSSAKEDEQTSPMTTRSMMSSQEILLEYLPYLRLITREPSEMTDLEKITRFRDTIGRNNDISDEDLDVLEDLGVEHWATDPIPKTPQKRRISRKMPPPPPPYPPLLQAADFPGRVEAAVDKLVLSDDDIED
ncbi:RFC checkpoint protein Rad17 [Emydomyces testavorans]|uniref:RFC checkpoint protein Rad17 n=1 Tax=Emydomyces testavorans TaxID=2070801 RepID=A0AAF0DKC1_9EURO|nr:RFC checkpoint protein Rad17 [Emydomyces testavorans]